MPAPRRPARPLRSATATRCSRMSPNGMSLDETAGHVTNVRELARQGGRDIDVYTVGVVTCRPDSSARRRITTATAIVDNADWRASTTSWRCATSRPRPTAGGISSGCAITRPTAWAACRSSATPTPWRSDWRSWPRPASPASRCRLSIISTSCRISATRCCRASRVSACARKVTGTVGRVQRSETRHCLRRLPAGYASLRPPTGGVRQSTGVAPERLAKREKKWLTTMLCSRRACRSGVKCWGRNMIKGRENLAKPPDRAQHLLLRQPRPLAAHDEVVDAEQLAVARDLLLHRHLVADDEPVAREILERACGVRSSSPHAA